MPVSVETSHFVTHVTLSLASKPRRQTLPSVIIHVVMPLQIAFAHLVTKEETPNFMV